MDKLKKHINKNRSELDHIEQPNMDKIWAGIQLDLKGEKKITVDNFTPSKKSEHLKVVTKKPRRFTLWALATAASIALLIGVGVGYLMQPATLVEDEPFNLANYAPDLVDQAADYKQLVDTKMSEIDFQSLDTLAFSEILHELEEIDGEYQNWTKDVPQYVHEQELLEFLQRHYEQKIRILEILSKEIEKKAHYEEREIRL